MEVVKRISLVPKQKSRVTPRICPVCRGLGWNNEQIFKSNKSYRLESQNCSGCNGEKVIWGS